MIHSLRGKVTHSNDSFIVIETAGIGFRVRASRALCAQAGRLEGEEMKVFCFWQPESLDLYGFSDEQELAFFELLNSISGIGPKMALKIMNGVSVGALAALIRRDLREELSRVTGVSAKTASKVILELKEKIADFVTEEVQEGMADVEDALRNLGYAKKDIAYACSQISKDAERLEDRLRQALKALASGKSPRK